MDPLSHGRLESGNVRDVKAGRAGSEGRLDGSASVAQLARQRLVRFPFYIRPMIRGVRISDVAGQSENVNSPLGSEREIADESRMRDVRKAQYERSMKQYLTDDGIFL